MILKNKCFWAAVLSFSMFFSFVANLLCKAEQNEYEEKKKQILIIADNIWSSVGVAFSKPNIEVVNKKIDVNDVSTLISFNPKTSIIRVGVEFFDFCMEEGEAAFAIVLAHEMGHYFNMHRSFSDVSGYMMTDNEKQIVKDNISSKDLDKMKELETQADLFAMFHCYSAGYDIDDVWPGILEKIYTLAKNPEDRYLDLEQRKVIINIVRSNYEHLLPLISISKYLFLISEHELNAEIFSYIIDNNYTSWDMFFNAGVSYLNAATLAMEQQDSLYIPLLIINNNEKSEISENYSIKRSLNPDHPGREDYINSMIAQSMLKFNYLVQMYPDLMMPYIFISILYYLDNDLKLARNYAIKAKELASNKFEKNISHTVLGIIYSKLDKELALKELKEAEGFDIADKNIDILRNGDSKNIKIPSDEKREMEYIDSVNAINYFKIIEKNLPTSYKYSELDNIRIEEYEFNRYNIYKISNNYGNCAIIETSSDYDLPSARGINRGDDQDALVKAYGHPDKISFYNNNKYYKYLKNNIIFEINNNKVTNWMIYDI